MVGPICAALNTVAFNKACGLPPAPPKPQIAQTTQFTQLPPTTPVLSSVDKMPTAYREEVLSLAGNIFRAREEMKRTEDSYTLAV